MADDKKEVVAAELELEGKVFFVEKDEDGNVISRDELDGELVLQALMTVIQAGVRDMKEALPLPEEEKDT
jgi:hypothetical protein